MKQAVGRILSFLVVAFGWVLFGVRVVLDLIGYSTAPEDIAVARTRLDQGLDLLLVVPWWAYFSFALISSLWLMYVSWPRHVVQQQAHVKAVAVEAPPILQQPKAKNVPKEWSPFSEEDFPESFVPLLEAARLSYEGSRNTLLAEEAERECPTPQAILLFYAKKITAISKVYANRPPSTVIEHVHEMRLSRLTLVYDAVSTAVDKNGKVIYENLSIDEREMKWNIDFFNRKYRR
jgi:hypothetical protein